MSTSSTFWSSKTTHAGIAGVIAALAGGYAATTAGHQSPDVAWPIAIYGAIQCLIGVFRRDTVAKGNEAMVESNLEVARRVENALPAAVSQYTQQAMPFVNVPFGGAAGTPPFPGFVPGWGPSSTGVFVPGGEPEPFEEF